MAPGADQSVYYIDKDYYSDKQGQFMYFQFAD